MDAFGIFEGGGARGLAHVGALKAAEDNDVQFIGVAGTSAGAIVAALVACGYRANEIYSPNNAGALFSIDFLQFFDQSDWQNLGQFQKEVEEAKQLFAQPTFSLRFCCALRGFVRRNREILSRLFTQRGILQTQRFEKWLEQALLARLREKHKGFEPTGPDGRVAFCDLTMPLKIIAADVSSQSIRVCCQEKTPTESVSSAVAASISIPLVFVPKLDDGRVLVDGGILSNFPAWVFDSEKRRMPPFTPTFGFRLIGKDEGSRVAMGKDSPFPDYLTSLFYTSVFGDNALETRAVDNLHEIPLRVRIGPLDFNIQKATKDDVYGDGRHDAQQYFVERYVGPRDPLYVKEILHICHKTMLGVMGYNGHLRVNVMRPINYETLRIVYTFNMDSEDDCDDQLEFRFGVGACGHCWRTLGPVTCDLEDARVTYSSKWKMDKRQQRLVRAGLRSLLSLPVFDPRKLRSSIDAPLRQSFIGVLNFDSDDRILERFADDTVLKTAHLCAGLVAERLSKR